MIKTYDSVLAIMEICVFKVCFMFFISFFLIFFFLGRIWCSVLVKLGEGHKFNFLPLAFFGHHLWFHIFFTLAVWGPSLLDCFYIAHSVEVSFTPLQIARNCASSAASLQVSCATFQIVLVLLSSLCLLVHMWVALIIGSVICTNHIITGWDFCGWTP